MRSSFVLLFAGQGISAVGDRLAPIALAFAVLDLTGSASDLGLVLAAQAAPVVVLVLVGGVWADRFPRRRVMLVADMARAVTQGASAALIIGGAATLWELVVLQALYGSAQAFFEPAVVAIVPQTVTPETLQQANALLEMSENLAWVIGPAVAGMVVAMLGPGIGLAIDAGTFAVSAACVAGIRVATAAGAPRCGMAAELRAGWRAFRSRTWLWVTVLLFAVVIGAVFSPMLVLGPQVARETLGGSGAWATISAARGLGAILGGVVALRWRPRYPLRAAFIGFLVTGPAFLTALAVGAPLELITILAVCQGASVTFFSVLWSTGLGRAIPAHELARTSSWDYLGSLALQPVGYVLTGPLAAVVGVSATLIGAGAVFVLVICVALTVPAIRDFSDESSPARGPDTAQQLANARRPDTAQRLANARRRVRRGRPSVSPSASDGTDAASNSISTATARSSSA